MTGYSRVTTVILTVQHQQQYQQLQLVIVTHYSDQASLMPVPCVTYVHDRLAYVLVPSTL